MSSLTKENDRGYICYRIRIFLDGKRRSIRLGGMNKKDAHEVHRHVDELVRAYETGLPAATATVQWTAKVDSSIREKLVEWGLCEAINPRTKEDSGKLLKPFLTHYISERTVCTDNTIGNFNQTKRLLVEYFSENKIIRLINAADADRWRRWSLAKPVLRGQNEAGDKTLAPATVSKHVKRAKTIFGDAAKDRLIHENPFADLNHLSTFFSATSFSRLARRHAADRCNPLGASAPRTLVRRE